MRFDWTVRSLKEWEDFQLRAPKSNWMQTWAYAQASFKIDYLASRMALILSGDKAIGMMCVQSITLGPFQIINLKRGPLWFKEPSPDLIFEFAKLFRREFPKSIFQRMRWMPEFDTSSSEAEATVSGLRQIGFKLRQESFVTSWLDLTRPESELRAEFEQKWRNCLNKAEKQNLTVKADFNLRKLPLFFQAYLNHLLVKKYKGPSVNFLEAEFQELFKTQSVCLFWAFTADDRPVAGVAVAFHGNTASYRLGWNTQTGRKTNAHYLLIWKALLLAKHRGAKSFDLGGLLPDDAPGVTHFKEGLGGTIQKFITLS